MKAVDAELHVTTRTRLSEPPVPPLLRAAGIRQRNGQAALSGAFRSRRSEPVTDGNIVMAHVYDGMRYTPLHHSLQYAIAKYLMSTATIVIVFFVLVLGSIALIFVSQAREKARLEHARRQTALEDAHSRMRRLLEDIPPQYLAPELQLLLIDRALEIDAELKALGSKLDVAAMENADREYTGAHRRG